MNTKNSNIFRSIFQKYDTDKTEPFSDAYNQLFAPIRDKIKLIFEIGVNRGGSVKAWKEFFPHAVIVGIDIGQYTYFEDDRIKIEIGSGSDENFINSLLEKYGTPDIVIDDGSHFSSDIKKSFQILIDKTKLCYVIEDYGTQTPSYKNGFYINDGSPATNILVDNIEKLLLHNKCFHAIHVFYSIAFFFKKGDYD